MARETSKPGQGGRTAGLRRSIGRGSAGWRSLLRSRELGRGVLTGALFVVLCTAITLWTRAHPLVGEGRVMRTTETVRTPFERIDAKATASQRELVRRRTPWIFSMDEAAIEGVRTSLEGLPLAMAGVETFDGVTPEVRQQFGLTPPSFEVLRALAIEGEVAKEWMLRVERLDERLRRWAPIIDSQTHQRLVTSGVGRIELQQGDVNQASMDPERVIILSGQGFEERIRELAGPGTNDIGQRGAGFDGELLEVVVRRLTLLKQPTYTWHEAKTVAAEDEAAALVEPTMVSYANEHVIFSRGEALTTVQLGLYRESMQASDEATPFWSRWGGRLGVAGVMAAVAITVMGYCAAYVPRVRRNPTRGLAIAGLFVGGLIAAAVLAVQQPGMMALAASAPAIFVAVIVTIAYDQRVALALGLLHAVLVCVALDQPVTQFAVAGLAVGAAVWRLAEIRDRNALIRMGLVVAAVCGTATLFGGLVDLPLSAVALRQIGWDACLAAAGGVLVAGIVLFILPTVERAFDITTGMTLIELRDPKQPLLRQLQQRAPGTYNHSLNVASLGEAAADAIGADGLLTYVGSLYHDIGKMNKPEYFVENQPPGINKHDKLSPAMSLLIIVGHVKDGVELAREFGLPRPLHHFIEAHHGTTLVEYFFHRAKLKAEEEGGDGDAVSSPAEIEYRYPGPKPRTKEVAIIMLCDAVESAARAMPDPAPSRIDTLVREIANKRLMDGQFDECDLSLRELHLLVETISKTLAAIYHGRIAYPSKKKDEQPEKAKDPAGAMQDPGVERPVRAGQRSA